MARYLVSADAAAATIGALSDYHWSRMAAGIGEGPADFPPGQSLPLESNLDFSNGVSFQKGCYLGQELTARTHHTGVVRKRLLPLFIAAPSAAGVAGEPPTDVLLESGKATGKVRSALEAPDGSGAGIALVLFRLANLGAGAWTVAIGGKPVQVTPQVPAWWPDDATEDRN